MARLGAARGAGGERGAAAARAPAGVRRARAGHERAQRGVRHGHAHQPRELRGGAAGGGRCLRAGRVAARGRRACRLLRAAPARPPRRAGHGDGLLPVRERGHRGSPRARLARRRARARARLGRAPRQRDQRDLPRLARAAVREHPPVPVLAGHGPARRRGRGGGRGLLDQPARAGGDRRGGVPVADRARRDAGRAAVPPRPHPDLGGLRRASPRPARRARAGHGLVRRHVEPHARARAGARRAGGRGAGGRLRPGRARRLGRGDDGGARARAGCRPRSRATRWPRTPPTCSAATGTSEPAAGRRPGSDRPAGLPAAGRPRAS